MPALGMRTFPPIPGSVRSILLIAFGTLLGWSGSSIVHFYDRPPVPSPMRELDKSEPVSRPAAPPRERSGGPPEAPPRPAGVMAPDQQRLVPQFGLLGGNEAPTSETLFCRVLVANPAGCEFEARLRLDEPPSLSTEQTISPPGSISQAGAAPAEKHIRTSSDGRRSRQTSAAAPSND